MSVCAALTRIGSRDCGARSWDAISGDRTLNISAPVVTAQGAGYECDTFEVCGPRRALWSSDDVRVLQMKFKLSNAGAETHSIESLRIEYKPLNDLEWLVVPDDYIKWGMRPDVLAFFFAHSNAAWQVTREIPSHASSARRTLWSWA